MSAPAPCSTSSMMPRLPPLTFADAPSIWSPSSTISKFSLIASPRTTAPCGCSAPGPIALRLRRPTTTSALHCPTQPASRRFLYEARRVRRRLARLASSRFATRVDSLRWVHCWAPANRQRIAPAQPSCPWLRSRSVNPASRRRVTSASRKISRLPSFAHAVSSAIVVPTAAPDQVACVTARRGTNRRVFASIFTSRRFNVLPPRPSRLTSRPSSECRLSIRLVSRQVLRPG